MGWDVESWERHLWHRSLEDFAVTFFWNFTLKSVVFWCILTAMGTV